MTQKFLESVIVGVALMHATLVGIASLYSVWRFRRARTRVHIASLAVSHCILTSLVATGLVRYWNDAWWINNFRTPLAIIAFGLTIFGLFQIMYWMNGKKHIE